MGRKYCLLFIRLLGTVVPVGFQQVPYAPEQLAVLSCIEHERLEFEVIEVRIRRQYLTRLRRLSCQEQAE
jgi:hypothetical protein